MKPPILSIITISLDNALELEATMKSLTKFSAMVPQSKWEHILLAQSSDDKNYTYKFNEKYNWNLNIFNGPALGIFNAYNIGIKKAQGEWVLLLNAGDSIFDTELLVDFVLSCCDKSSFEAHCYGARLFRHQSYMYNRLPKKTFLQSIIGHCKIVHPAVIYKKTVFNTVGFFDISQTIAGDFKHHWQMYIAGIKVKTELKPLIDYDMSGVSSHWLKGLHSVTKIHMWLYNKIPTWLWLVSVFILIKEYLRYFLFFIFKKLPFSTQLKQLWHWSQRKKYGTHSYKENY